MSDQPTSAALPEIEIYTDGACEPNPGTGGYGAVLIHPKKRGEISGGFRKTTLNAFAGWTCVRALRRQSAGGNVPP